ncbi:putative Centromere protein Chl4/mis15/CENP-N [Seiridium cardinale]
MPRLTVPTTARLSSSLRVEASNAAVVKLLNRLSRASLLSLVLDWLADNSQSLCPPALRHPDDDDETDDFYPLANSLEELREIYANLQAAKGSRRDVVDRVIEGDWRDGLTLYQLAMADLQYLYDHPVSLKWTAFKIERLMAPRNEDDAEAADRTDKETLDIPRFHPSTFLQNLQAEVLPDVKAHYNFDRPKDLPLLLLRIFILDSPYNTGLAASSRLIGSAAATNFESSKTIYIAFPDSSPHIYISKSHSTGATSNGDSRSLSRLVLEGIPKALSRPRERYTLKPTNLSSKNLEGLLALKGAGRTNAAGGGWGIYAEDDRKDSPLNAVLPTPPLSEISGNQGNKAEAAGEKKKRKRGLDPNKEKEGREAKRRKEIAQARFGHSAQIDDGKGVERLDVLVEDLLPGPHTRQNQVEEDEEDAGSRQSRRPRGRKSGIELELEKAREHDESITGVAEEENGHRPRIRFTFTGPHVFAGIRQLVESGIIDGERMPGWMTGEEGVTTGIVINGKMRGYKGSGI